MSVLEENIKRVNGKLAQLLKQYQLLQKENEHLKTALGQAKAVEDNSLLRINELEQQVGILKSVAGKMKDPEKKHFEKAISQYIRDVDKCIGLLSE